MREVIHFVNPIHLTCLAPLRLTSKMYIRVCCVLKTIKYNYDYHPDMPRIIAIANRNTHGFKYSLLTSPNLDVLGPNN
jgi:hypothetical protein